MVKSEYIALIFNEDTKELLMVVETDSDMFLQDPSYMKDHEETYRYLFLLP